MYKYITELILSHVTTNLSNC